MAPGIDAAAGVSTTSEALIGETAKDGAVSGKALISKLRHGAGGDEKGKQGGFHAGREERQLWPSFAATQAFFSVKLAVHHRR